MSRDMILAGTDEDSLLEEALTNLKLPREAVEYDVTTEVEEELLPGARPRIELHVRIRSEWLADRAAEHIENILKLMEVEGEVTREIEDGVCYLNINAPEAAAAIIGRKGDGLDAWQYLVMRMVLRVGRDAPLVVIDCENYRKRQFEKLKKLAERAIARARKTGNEIELDPMPPLERKFLHHFLLQEKDIQTFSRGDEPERFLVIISEEE